MAAREARPSCVGRRAHLPAPVPTLIVGVAGEPIGLLPMELVLAETWEGGYFLGSVVVDLHAGKGW